MEQLNNSNPKLFQLKTSFDIDKEKESMVFIIKEPLYEYSHQYAFIGDFMDILEKKYNIIIISIANNKPNRHNYFVFNKNEYDRLKDVDMLRKKEDSHSCKHNSLLLDKEFFKSFDYYFKDLNITKIFLGFHEYLILPLTGYVNENDYFKTRQNKFHDCVETSGELLEKTKSYIKYIGDNYDEKVSILAFSMYDKNLVSNLIRFIYKTYNADLVYTLNVDPSVFFGFFDSHDIKYKNYYYATDKRGTRNFDYFPLAHFQHIFTEHKYLKFPGIVPKTNEFFLSGSLLHHNDGARSDDKFMMDYLQPLEKLNPKRNSLWSPIKLNGLYLRESQVGTAYAQKCETKAKELKSEFTNYLTTHPLYKGFFLTKNLTNTIASYKYGMILRCVTFADSLNPRPVHYTYLGILPFLDPQYDPEFLCIPEFIQKHLIVNDGNDILKKIEYYNIHEEERLYLLKQLYEHFKIDEFTKTWKKIIYDAF